MTVPLMVLAGLSVLGGALNLPGLHSLEHWLEPSLGHALEHAGEEVTGLLAISWGGFNPIVALFSTLLALAAV